MFQYNCIEGEYKVAKIPNQQKVIGFGQILAAFAIITILAPVFLTDVQEFYQELKANDFEIWPWIKQPDILWLVIKLIIVGQFLLYGIVSFFSGKKQISAPNRDQDLPKDYVDVNVVHRSIISGKNHHIVPIKGFSAKLARFLSGKRLTTAPDFLQFMAISVTRSSCKYAFLTVLMIALPYIPQLNPYEPHLSKITTVLARLWGSLAILLLFLPMISLPLRKAKNEATENSASYQNILGHFRTLMQQMIGKTNDFRQGESGNRAYSLQSDDKGIEGTNIREFEGNFLVETQPVVVNNVASSFISFVFMFIRAALLALIALVLASELREYFIMAMQWLDIENFILDHDIPHEQLVIFSVQLAMIFIFFGAIAKLGNTFFEIAIIRSRIYIWKSDIFVGKIAGSAVQEKGGGVVCTEANVTVYATEALSYTGEVTGERRLFSFEQDYSLEEKANTLVRFFQERNTNTYSRPSAPPLPNAHKNLMDDEIARIDRESKKHFKKDF